jgi:ferrous iron transport protein A
LETIRFLESLGFVQGGEVALVAKCGGNVIVRVKGSRVAIARDIADRIEI